MTACLHAKIDAIKLLNIKGADHTLRNRNDETALDWAALSDNTRAFLRMLQKFVTLNQKDNVEKFNEIFNYENKVWGLTLLTRLVLENKYKVAKLLFNSKVNVNYQHIKDGETVLHKAIKNGNKKAIGFCLYIGWNKELKNNKGESFKIFSENPEYDYLNKIEEKVKVGKGEGKSINKLHLSRIRRKSHYFDSNNLNVITSPNLALMPSTGKTRSIPRTLNKVSSLNPDSQLNEDEKREKNTMLKLSTIKDEEESVLNIPSKKNKKLRYKKETNMNKTFDVDQNFEQK